MLLNRKHEISGRHYITCDRKAPYTEFKTVFISLDEHESVDSSPVFKASKILIVDMELKENDLISFMNTMCPQCRSRNVIRNGTCLRKMENGTYIRDVHSYTVRIQKYICRDCSYSFVARPPIYGYGKHYLGDVREKGVKTRVKTSLRKAADLFRIIGNMIISLEPIRRSISSVPDLIMASSGYFVYDEQYTHIHGIEKDRGLLMDAGTGNFVKEILGDLREDTHAGFMMRALSRFTMPEEIFITTDGYHYESLLKEVSQASNIRIRRQRYLFHIKKDLAHRIKDAWVEEHLDMARRLAKYMFFPSGTNLYKLGKNCDLVRKLTEGRSEKEVVEIILGKIHSIYEEDRIMAGFLSLVKRYRNTSFLYLSNPDV